MNIRLLIAAILFLVLFSCRTISESTSYEYKNLSISVVSDSITDERYEAILAPYREQIEQKMSEVIGFTNEGLISYRPESPLSNYLSDLILDFAVFYSNENNLDGTPVFSLFNHGGIRASLPQGEIKVLNAYQVMPFENELVLLKLSGDQVVSLADYICTRNGEGVAGISFGMLENKAVDIKIQGAKVDVNRHYWMVTSDYIANGGDGMRVLTWASDRVDTGFKIRDIMIEHFREMNERGEAIHGKSDGRIYHAE